MQISARNSDPENREILVVNNLIS